MAYEDPTGSAPVAALPNSNLALVSLITGILGLTFIPIIGSIIAVITGPMAKREITESGGTLGGEGLATAGIVLGWIGIGFTVLGLCVGAFFIAIPLCGVLFGLSTDAFNLLIPGLISLLF